MHLDGGLKVQGPNPKRQNQNTKTKVSSKRGEGGKKYVEKGKKKHKGDHAGLVKS